jgi:hypothetical protein
MKLRPAILPARIQTGMLLIQCLVYIAVFAILLGLGTAAFYFCWNHSEALITSTNDIEAALHMGERWRADVRSATGKITVETTSKGEVIQIPEGEKEVVYRYADGELCRQAGPSAFPEVLLPKVKTSEMREDLRGSVIAWQWSVELLQHRKETHLPLWFTFEAVAPTKP